MRFPSKYQVACRVAQYWGSPEAHKHYWNMRLQAVWLSYESLSEGDDAQEAAHLYKQQHGLKR